MNYNHKEQVLQRCGYNWRSYKNPIGVRLQQTGSSLDGRSEAVLAGDLIGSITPYVSIEKKIFKCS